MPQNGCPALFRLLFSFNSMPQNGCPALHELNPSYKKFRLIHVSSNFSVEVSRKS